MAGLESVFAAVGTWFGFVGSCVAGSGPACRPFLAFVALTAAAGAALTLLVMAWRAFQQEQTHARKQTREQSRHERVRHASAQRAGTQRAQPRRDWQVTA